MPADDGLRSHHQQSLSPMRPDLRKSDPETAVRHAPAGSWALSLHYRQLLPKGEILQSQFFKLRRENQMVKDREQEPEHADEYRVYSGDKSIISRPI